MGIAIFDREHRIQEVALRFVSGGIGRYWDVVLAPLVENDEVIGRLNVTIDPLKGYSSNKTLSSAWKNGPMKSRPLLRVSQEMSSTLELESLLQLVLDQLKKIVDYTGASILTPEEDILSIRAYRGPIPMEQSSQLRFPLETAMTEGLGLNIMQERARSVGAQFEITSKTGEGTEIPLAWKDPA